MGIDWSGKSALGPAGGPIFKSDVDDLHRVEGYNVKWEKAAYCPNRIDDRFDKHDFNCSVCENRMGIVYYDPLTVDADGDALRALITGLSKEQQYRVEGFLDMGSAYISIPGPYEPSYFDRITLINSRMRVQELIKRGADTGAGGSLTDRLRHSALPSSDADGGVVKVIDEDGTDRTANATIDANGDVLFDSSVISSDKIYSVVYYRRPAYIVMDIPHAVRDNRETEYSASGPEVNKRLGTQVLGKLDFLIRDTLQVI